MNQSLINEIRAETIRISRELNKIDTERERIGNPWIYQDSYSKLLQAKASNMQALAVLVAASKR